MQGTRHNQSKAMLSLVPLEGMEAFARAGAFGITKYDRDNWKKGLPLSEIMDSLLRHTGKASNSNCQAIDEESGLNHIDHVVWNAMALAYGLEHGWPYLRGEEVNKLEPYNDNGVIKVPKSWWVANFRNYFITVDRPDVEFQSDNLHVYYTPDLSKAMTSFLDSISQADNYRLNLKAYKNKYGPSHYSIHIGYHIAKQLSLRLDLGAFKAIEFDEPIKV